VGLRFTGSETVERFARVAAPVGGDTTVHTIRSAENNDAYEASQLDTLKVRALFNTDDELPRLVPHLLGMLGAYSVPPPVWVGPKLAHSLYPDLHAGSWTVITWASAPVNPFTGARGWSSVLGRVLSISIEPGDIPVVGVDIELFTELGVGRVAPAADVSAFGTDGGNAFIDPHDAHYVADQHGDKDWWYFEVGDLIEARDASGAVVNTTPMTIMDFGSNHVSDPTAAASSRVWFDEASITYNASPVYFTLKSWSAGNTARMEKYSAYADAAGALTGPDSAKRYG